jgi:hypothetical protein
MPDVNSMDLVIEEYKKHVDRTLIEDCLKRSVDERIRALEVFEEFREELQAAMKKARRDEIR